MKWNVTVVFFFTTFTLSLAGHSQKTQSTDYYKAIRNADVSKCWYNDEDQPQNDSSMAAIPEPLGFIGENYQRFYIHFISVKKNKAKPYQYKVTGKTRVKGNVCRFTGMINIVKAELFKEKVDGKYTRGILESEILFYEDSLHPETGVIKGKLTSKFYLDENNQAWYDDLEVGADGFSNNQCEAVWTSYKTQKSKKCNWGDYRIPQSKALDSGDGEFAVDKKYDLFGWKNYRIAWTADPWKNGTGQARDSEKRHWWE
ncbi:MAG: hypothetical protein ABI151_01525 [Chitinophagaceae bacterium]